MVSEAPSFRSFLNGPAAFYKQPDYEHVSQQEFGQEGHLPVGYTYNTESKIRRFINRILSISLFFPLGSYQYMQGAIGANAVLPAAKPQNHGYPQNYAYQLRQKLTFEGEWKYKRFTVEVDGLKIDAALMGKSSTFHNGRWVLASNGNLQFYEQKLLDNGFKATMMALKSNAVVFNYPGVGASLGSPTRSTMVKAYRAMMKFLEDEKNGIGAREIIGIGHSIGGGVQGAALNGYELRKDIKYVFVKSRTFSNIRQFVGHMLSSSAASLPAMFDWNLDSVESSKQLSVPEIILQTANVEKYELLTDSAKIISDGVIPAEASLAKALLDDQACPRVNKVFIGIPEGHNESFTDNAFIANQIEKLLKAKV